MVTLKQQLADVYYEWWETGAKEHIAETEAAITGVPTWQRELERTKDFPKEHLGFTPDRPWATHFTTGHKVGGRIWLQHQAEGRRLEAARRLALQKQIEEVRKARAAEEARLKAEREALARAAKKPTPPERIKTWIGTVTRAPKIPIPEAEPKPAEGWSITQKYFELMGTGFDPKTGKVYRKVKFYKPGERERLMEEKAVELKPTYEKKYQEEFEKKYGKKIEAGEISFYQASKEFDKSKEAERISITYEKEFVSVAPTSKVGNLIVGLTDFLFKAQFFSPFMSTAQAAKSKKAKTKQEIVYVRDFKSLNKVDYNTFLNQVRARYSTQQLREMYATALRTGESKKIKLVEQIIKDLHAPTKVGKKASLDFLKDVKTQEGMIAERTIFPAGIEPAGMPTTLKAVPEVITGVKAITIQKDIAKQQAKETQRLNRALRGLTITETKAEQRARQKLKLGISLAQPQVQLPKFAQPQPQKIANILGFVTPTPSPKPIPKPIPKFVPGFILPPYAREETQAERRRRKIKEAKIRKQQRAYQASVASAVLGIAITKKEAKRLPKVFTGLELRPMVKNNYYGKGGLSKMQSSRKLSRKSVRRLKAQQKALVEAGRGGRKAHKKRLQRERAAERKRIRLYKSKKSQIKALKTKGLRKRKPKRKQIINRINELFK